MKDNIQQWLQTSIESLQADGTIPDDIQPKILVERARDEKHGDYATNLAMTLAGPARTNPRELAAKIMAALPKVGAIKKVEIAGPGFINFYLEQNARNEIISAILTAGDEYGLCNIGNGVTLNIEFVSANPTGPLHVGHGRGAAYGASLANLLKAIGYKVHREYYVNDAGRQMDILATSIWLRYLEAQGAEFAFPTNGYKGEYIKDISAQLVKDNGDKFAHPVSDIFTDDIPADEVTEGEGDKEAHIDALINKSKTLLGDGYAVVHKAGLTSILDDIRDDLAGFGVEFDEWFSEKKLQDNEAIQHSIDKLNRNGHLYEKNGAIWFKTSELGDDKDRVLVRDNGQTTYFASDVAYHMNKFERGYERCIDILGADHHGYIPRLNAAITAMGGNAKNFSVNLVQFATLWRGDERVQMSTRSGSFVTLRELREEVGKDAARFFYVMRKSEQHMDFDLELAKSQSNENPVYYIQYAHARICSVLRQLPDKGYSYDQEQGLAKLERLDNDQEKALITQLSRYAETIANAGKNCEPHMIAHYLRALANDFHSYYNAHQFLVEDADLRNARIALVLATKQVLSNGLSLLDVSAPEEM